MHILRLLLRLSYHAPSCTRTHHTPIPPTNANQVIGDPAKLAAFLARLDEGELTGVAARLKLLDPEDEATAALVAAHGGKPFLLAVLCDWHADRVSMIQQINERPLYPSEEVLWDTNVVPTANQSSSSSSSALSAFSAPSTSAIDGTVLALPKLNLQVRGAGGRQLSQ